MVKKNIKEQTKVAAQSKKRGGRSKTASRISNDNALETATNTNLANLFECNICEEVMQEVVVVLHEMGIQAADIFDPQTGIVTEGGETAIAVAVGKAWRQASERMLFYHRRRLEEAMGQKRVFNCSRALCVEYGRIPRPRPEA